MRIAAFLLPCLVLTGLAVAPAAVAKQDTYYFWVLNGPAPDREASYNEWYDHQHAPDVVSVPGFVSAQRYVFNEHQLRADAKAPTKYMVEYKIVTDDLKAVYAEVNRRLREKVTFPAPAGTMASGGGKQFTYRAITDVTPGGRGDAAPASKDAPSRYVQIVFSNATPGKEAQFNDWYSRIHGPSVASTKGFQQFQRFELSPVQLSERDTSDGFLIRFAIETRDIDAVFARYREDQKTQTGLPPLGEAGKIGQGWTYRAIGPLLIGDEVRADRAKRGCVIVAPTAPCQPGISSR